MKSVLITGAASGTGFSIAANFSKCGYNAYITSRNRHSATKAAGELAKQFQNQTAGFEVAPDEGENAVKEIFKELDEKNVKLETLVLNAANLGLNMNPLKVDISEWAQVIQTNLTWNFTLCRYAASRMRKNNGGSIVFIGSNTYRRAIPNRSAYIASKSGIVGLTKALAIDFAEDNIRVNCLLAGSIYTTRWDSRSEESRQALLNKIPLSRIATPEDIAEAVFYLATAKQVTGAELVLDGGIDATM